MRLARPRGLCGARMPGALGQGYSQCAAEGRVVAGVEVDHTIPHRGDERLLHDLMNLELMCKECHARKTTTRDGGFGHAKATDGEAGTCQ